MSTEIQYRLRKVLSRAVLVTMALALLVTACNRLEEGGYFAQTESGCRVIKVIDGDTIDLACPESSVERTRLVGFDTPEKFDARCDAELQRARLAEDYLRGIFAKADTIEVQRLGLDRYHRRLAVVTLDGRDLAEHMISAGHARAYSGGPRQGWCP